MVLATLLLSGAWLMKPVPVFVFAALAPLIAISEQAKPGLFWEKLEYILVAFLFSFWAARLFDLQFVLAAIGQAIVFTLVFAAVAAARPALGNVAAALVFVATWLGVEFLLLKTGLAPRALFLADALSGRPEWTRWTPELGYLATTAWILVANLALHQTFWSGAPIRWGWLTVFVVWVVAPIIYSLLQATDGVTREQMLALYASTGDAGNGRYALHGEVVARTCSWVAALVILFTLVKLKINRK
jgi:hypothetical protein